MLADPARWINVLYSLRDQFKAVEDGAKTCPAFEKVLADLNTVNTNAFSDVPKNFKITGDDVSYYGTDLSKLLKNARMYIDQDMYSEYGIELGKMVKTIAARWTTLGAIE